MSIRWIAKGMMGVAMVLAVTFASEAGHAQEKIRIGYIPVADYLPVFIAQEKGYFKANGLEVELQRVSLISNIPPALLNGDLQLGNNTPTGLLQAAAAGIDLVIVAGAARISRDSNPISLVVRKDSGIRSAADLKGKRLAVPSFGSSLDLLLRLWLENQGIKPSDIQFVEANFSIQTDALKSKMIDAAIVAEPFRGRMYEAGIAEKLSDFLPEIANDRLGNLWQSTRKWADSHKVEIAALRKSMQQGIDFMKADPAGAHEIEKKYLNLNAPDLPNIFMDVKVDDLQFYLDLCRRYGLIDRDLDLKSLLVP